MARLRVRSRRLALGTGLAVCLALVALLWRPWEDTPARPAASSLGGATPEHTLSGDPDGAIELTGIARAGRTQGTVESASGPAARPDVPTPAPPLRTLTGRVVGPDGEPPVQSHVSIAVHGEGAPPLDRTRGGRRPGTLTGADGRFEVRVTYGARATVHVTPQETPPFQATFEVPIAADQDLGVLRLDAGVPLAGRITLGGRAPALGRPLLLLAPQRPPGDVIMARQFGDRVAVETPQGAYVLSHSVTPDAEGRWRVEGLAPGAYVVTVFGFDGVPFTSEILERPRLVVQAPASDADIEVDACLVRVVPPAHMLLLSASPFWIEVNGPAGLQRRIIKESPRRGGFDLNAAEMRALEFLAPSHTELQVRAQFEGMRAWHTRVRTPTAGEVLTLVAELESVSFGTVHLVPTAGGATRIAHLGYELLEPGTTYRVALGSVTIGLPEPAVVSLPAGHHELRVWDPQDRWSLEQRTFVEVPAGALTEVSWAPMKGARIRAYVEPGPNVPIHLTLRRAKAEDVTLHFERQLHGVSIAESAGPLVAGDVGEQVSRAVEPGGARVRFEAEGYVTHEVPVKLVAGEFTDVKVRLEPLTPR